MSHILITGFTPFEGRAVNASWIAARSLVANHGTEHILHGLRIPVCWGQPRETLLPALERWHPHCIIAMGEGEKGQFKIETLARNQRKSRVDNAGNLPPNTQIDPLGPATRIGSAPCVALRDALSTAGFPIVVSTDAGAYLCEELLYNLEEQMATRAELKLVLFVHLPPFGSTLQMQDETRQCDENLLRTFTQNLFANCLKLVKL